MLLGALVLPLNASVDASTQIAATWRTIHNQGFEASEPWPNGKWITYDCSHTSTQGIWATTFSKAFNSTKSVHPRAGTTPYNYNTCTWMRYGPFSLGNATNARMTFKYFMETEVGYDFFGWYYSCDGVAEWTGRTVTGNGPSGNPSWNGATLSLKPCVGKTNVYVQFTFQSDQSVNYQGVWVDNVVIQKFS